MNDLRVRVQCDEGAELPAYGYPGDAGMDLAVVGDHTLTPGESRDLPTGLRVELPEGIWGRITGRSSTLRKRGLFTNEGVIDQGYRGELFVYVTNRTDLSVMVEHGTRLAQLILAPVVHAQIESVEAVADSARGVRGFGSTGHREWARAGDVAVAVAPDASVALNGQGDAFGALPGAVTVYLGGPIDHVATDPEARHRRLMSAAMMHGSWHHRLAVYCPACAVTEDPHASAQEVVDRNMVALLSAEWAVFEYAVDTPSVGTPIELHERVANNQSRKTLVVGGLGGGLFAQVWEESGVRVVESMAQAVSAMRGRA